jgi:hypothetical protein
MHAATSLPVCTLVVCVCGRLLCICTCRQQLTDLVPPMAGAGPRLAVRRGGLMSLIGQCWRCQCVMSPEGQSVGRASGALEGCWALPTSFDL